MLYEVITNLHEHLVQMPPPPAGFHSGNPPFSNLGRKHWTEPMPPVSHGFMADFDAAFVQQIFHIAERQRETNVQHHCQADNLAARFEVAKWGSFRRPAKLRNRPARLKPNPSDKTLIRAHGSRNAGTPM